MRITSFSFHQHAITSTDEPEAFRQYRLGGVHLSERGLAMVKRLLAGERVTQEDSGMSKREWSEVMETLGRSP